VGVEPRFTDDLLGRVELCVLRQVADIAGVDHQRGSARLGAHQPDRLAQRARRIGVRSVAEADMAIADLHEAKRAGVGSGRLGAAEQAGARHAAADGPEHPRTGPHHASEQAATRPAIVLFGCNAHRQLPSVA